MGFLYKHYEKIVLAVFLLVFVFALVYLIFVFSQSKEITEEDLRIKPQGDNYTRIFNEEGNENVAEGEKGRFSVKENFKEEKHWIPSKQRDPNSPASTDFMVPFKAARCNNCQKVIPISAFEKKRCILCGKEPGPVIEEEPEDTGTGDIDGDGMPDKFEKTTEGLNFEDSSDKWTDLDKDGYLNFTEFEAKTDLLDPKSHPPLADRLALIGIKRKMLTIKLVNLDKRNSADKKEWLITMKVINKRGKYGTEFKKIGETFKLDSRRNEVYKIIDAEYIITEKFDKSLGRPMDINVSEIKIQNAVKNDDKPITIVIGKPAYENRVRLGFRDTVSDKKYIMKDGDKFTVGNADIGTEEYTVIGVDLQKKEWVKIEDANKKQFEIGKVSKLEEIKSDFGNTDSDISTDIQYDEFGNEIPRGTNTRLKQTYPEDNLEL